MQTTANYTRVDPGYSHDVADNARRLAVLYTVEVELARLIGGWIPRVPELPEKLLLGRLVFEAAEHARLLEQRLLELRVAPDALAAMRRRTCEAFIRLERTEAPYAFLAGLFRVVKPALLADYRRHLDAAPPYVDDPTLRALRQIMRDEEGAIAAGLALLAERRIAWSRAPELDELWDLTAGDGGFLPGEFVGRDPVPQLRAAWPAAVEHVPYDGAVPAYPTDFGGAMRRIAHDLVFSEVEALDIFGRYVYEFHEFPWEFSQEAARIAWDEARHVELLLNVLARYGGTVGEFPAKGPAYEEFMRMDTPLEKLIMINVISEGEVSTDTQSQHRDAFRELGDELSALLKDYEMADEVNHGRFGLKWVGWLLERTGADYDAAYTKARASMEEFRGSHREGAGASPIPLVRLGLDELGAQRRVNVEAKRLVGFSEDEIERILAEGSSRPAG